MGDRKRIIKTKKSTEVTEIIEEFVQVKNFELNCASKNAKFIYVFKDFEIEIWIDKHYENRVFKGDESGERLGIEEETVKNIIIDSVKYIFHFYILHRISNFINFFNKEKPTKYRVVLKDYRNTQIPVNIVIEIHFLDYSKYEITTITAMKCVDFLLSDGQYVISVTNNYVNFHRFQNKSLINIDKILT